MSVWVVLVYVLAAARVTGLIALDKITEPVRAWVVAQLPARPAFVVVEYGLTCAWCVGLWVAALTVPLAWLWGTQKWLLGPALVLALSQAIGMTSAVGRPPEPEGATR